MPSLPQGGSCDLENQLCPPNWETLTHDKLLPLKRRTMETANCTNNVTCCTLGSFSHRMVVLSSAEDHTTGGNLLLRGAGGGNVLTATQRCCQAVWRDRGHCVGDGYVALLQLKKIQAAHIKTHALTNTGKCLQQFDRCKLTRSCKSNTMAPCCCCVA